MFIHDSSAQDIAAVTAGVEHLARGASSEAELERILLNELGCYYTPRPDLGGPSFHDCLPQVVAELKSSQAQPTLQADGPASGGSRSEEHTSALQSPMLLSYAGLSLKITFTLDPLIQCV